MTQGEFFDQLTIINMKKSMGEDVEGMYEKLYEEVVSDAYKDGYDQAKHDTAEFESFLNKVDWERA